MHQASFALLVNKVQFSQSRTVYPGHYDVDKHSSALYRSQDELMEVEPTHKHKHHKLSSTKNLVKEYTSKDSEASKKHVMDIRMALRRKYASRMNLGCISTQ